MEWYIFAGYLIVCNIVGFILMGNDKKRAKRKQRRIPERTLFLTAAIGGSIGSLAGMYAYRHKTKHKSFVFGMPAILVMQLLGAVLVMVVIQKN